MKNSAYFSALSFGDLVIELNFLKITSKTLITPYYNRPLLEALGYNGHVEYFGAVTDEIPPSFFNFRNSSAFEIVNSFLKLKFIIMSFQKRYDILFYERSVKWILLSNKFSKKYFLKEVNDNVYDAISKRFGIEFQSRLLKSSSDKILSVSIFPDSRQKIKSIPSSTIIKILECFNNKEFEIKIYSNRNMVGIENVEKLNSLKKLDSIISRSDLCVTADSMPLHLSFFRKVPVFVFALGVNWRLFPKNIIENEEFSDFNQIDNLKKWLNKI